MSVSRAPASTTPPPNQSPTGVASERQENEWNMPKSKDRRKCCACLPWICCCCYAIAVGLIAFLLIAAGVITILVVTLGKSAQTATASNSATMTLSNVTTTTSTLTTSTTATTTTVTSTTTSSQTTTTTTSNTATTTTTTATTTTTSVTTTTTSATTTTTSVTTTTTSTTTTTQTTTTTTSNSATTTTTTSATTTTSVTTTTTSATTTTTSATTTTTSVTTTTTSVTTTSTSATTTTVTSTTTTTTTTTKPICTTQITFDDIPSASSSSGVVPNGYKGLNWTNAVYINATSAPMSGYQVVTPTSPYVAHNPGGGNVTIRSANGTSFSFDSLTFASGWRDNMTLTISLFRLGAFRISTTSRPNTRNSTLSTCPICTNVDTIVLSTQGGIPRSGLAQNGTELVFDNLCISFGF